MKKTFLHLLFLVFPLTFSAAKAATMQELAGDYDVKSTIASGIAHIRADGTLTAEIYGLIYFTCDGNGGKIENNVYTVNSLCYTIPTIIKIDLSKVQDLNKFTAPVTTVIAGEMQMEFTRR